MTSLPKPLGSYSQYKIVDNLIFIAGQGSRNHLTNQEAGITLDSSGNLLSYDIKAQTTGCINNLRTVLELLNLNLTDVVDITVFLKVMADFTAYNQIYNEYFNFPNPPTRTTVGVLDLPGHNFIEIKAIAMQKEKS